MSYAWNAMHVYPARQYNGAEGEPLEHRGTSPAMFLVCFPRFINPSPPPITVDTINVPGSLATIATKINDSGQIVGIWIDSQGREHGFLLTAGRYSSIDVPGAIATEALALDNKSNLTIAGDYVDSAGSVHGFTLTAGQFKRVDVPQASATVVSGINRSNQMVGRNELPGGNTRGFIGNPGTLN